MSFFPVSDCTRKGENGEKMVELRICAESALNLRRAPSLGAPRAAVTWWRNEAKGWEMRQKDGK